MLATEEPDAGRTEYRYRRDGALRFSQNDLQREQGAGVFSYTHYDAQGRAVESGQWQGGPSFASLGSNTAVLESTAPNGGLAQGSGSDWVRTYYDASHMAGGQGYGTSVLTPLLSALGLPVGVPEGGPPHTALSGIPELGGLFADDADNDGLPYAHLNYLIFDKDYNLLPSGGSGFRRVSDGSNPGSNPGGDPALSAPPGGYTTSAETGGGGVVTRGGEAGSAASFRRLGLTVTIPAEGRYLYAWVSNTSDWDVDVFFDDLEVLHKQPRQVVEATDYYPFGGVVARYRSLPGYRYGYQGSFAEQDAETGWNSFELRQYDSRIGRWLSVDPYRQFASPYVGMGNDPASGVDPDGGKCDGCPDGPQYDEYRASPHLYGFDPKAGVYNADFLYVVTPSESYPAIDVLDIGRIHFAEQRVHDYLHNKDMSILANMMGGTFFAKGYVKFDRVAFNNDMALVHADITGHTMSGNAAGMGLDLAAWLEVKADGNTHKSDSNLEHSYIGGAYHPAPLGSAAVVIPRYVRVLHIEVHGVPMKRKAPGARVSTFSSNTNSSIFEASFPNE